MAQRHDKDTAPVNGCDPEQRYDKAFRDWLHELCDVLDFPDPEAPPAWVRKLFESSGRVPPDRFAGIAFERRRTDITEAFKRVAATVHTQTGVDLSAGNPDLALEHPSDEFPIGLVSFVGSPIWSADPPEMYVDIAEAVQSYLADRYRKVWPLCPRHHLGTHPRVAAGRSVWWCNGGAHESEPIFSILSDGRPGRVPSASWVRPAFELSAAGAGAGLGNDGPPVGAVAYDGVQGVPPGRRVT